ncbi:MAG: diphthine--ammonia ligase [Planctomycetota bacterium]|jgi:ABC transporter with metal-binding/Fe-S-binding domain ATP-binding protein
MRVAVLFSGGKDSMFALNVALEQGWEVKYLVSVISEREDSWMFHRPLVELTGLQAEAIGITHIIKTTGGEKEKELEDLMDVIKTIKPEVDAVISGAIASRYQKDRIDMICKELDLRSIAPLWGKDQYKLVKQQIQDFDIIFASVSTAGLNKSLLGVMLDSRTLEMLKAAHEKHGINISGEGGEYETFVMDGPIFKRRVTFEEIEKIWDDATQSGYIICKGAKLIDK